MTNVELKCEDCGWAGEYYEAHPELRSLSCPECKGNLILQEGEEEQTHD